MEQQTNDSREDNTADAPLSESKFPTIQIVDVDGLFWVLAEAVKWGELWLRPVVSDVEKRRTT